MSDNPIKHLKANTFSGLNNLKKLKLSRCEIELFEPGTLNGLDSLKILEFCDNPIGEIEADLLSGLNENNLGIKYTL